MPVLLWLTLVLGCVGGTNTSPINTNVDRLAPLINEQKAAVLAVVRDTDELDTIYKRRSTSTNALALYIEKYSQAHDKFEQLYGSLPKNDARMMLYNMMEVYENVGSLWMENERREATASPDTLMTIAQLRKALLTKIIEGTLTPEMVKTLEDLRHQDSDSKEAPRRQLKTKAEEVQEEKLSAQRREQYADELERKMLKEGQDFVVRVSGQNKTAITIRYVLMSRPFVYKLVNDSEFMERLRTLGFKKATFTDGYWQTWHYDLIKNTYS
jgi:hypothetical protein